MDNINCKVLEKLKKEKKISADELQKITTIAKEEIKFMVRNNIPLVPENYILWFSIFCHIIENDLKLSDLEIMGLFKEKYPSTKEIEAVIVEFEKDEKELVAHVAESINREISELLTSLEVHQEKLAEKQKDDQTIPVTVSIGVAAARKGIDETLLIEMADRALYLAKKSGKNQVKTDLDVELEGEK